MAKKSLAIFETFKTKSSEFTGEALRQRAIITCLAQAEASSDKTRTSISQYIAKENNVVWKNIYSGIFRDLDEILIPLGIVEEEGRLPLKRGPKALQENGMPYYHLTRKGLLVALSISVHRISYGYHHFLDVLCGGAIMGIFGGLSYWFPKFAGRMFNE